MLRGQIFTYLKERDNEKTINYTFLIPLFCSSQFVGILSNASSGGSSDTTWAWSLHGNAGTDSAVNFIGTLDDMPLVFKTNGTQIGKVNNSSETIFWGTNSGIGNSGSNVIGIGLSAALNNTADDVVGIGPAGLNNLGSFLVAIGSGAGNDNSGVDNSFIGTNAGANNSGSNSIGVGVNALANNTYNQAVGIGENAQATQSNQFALSDSFTTIYANLNGQTNGYVLTTNGTTADWQPFTGEPIKDSIDATGATVSPAINTTHVITSAGAITSATLSFPAGTTGNWIIVVFNKAIATLTNSGTGSSTVSLVTPLLGTSKTYVNVGGNWY